MNAERARAGSETLVAVMLAALIAALLGGAWARGLSVFWSDLTYLHHAWRAAPAMLVAAGRPPLWEPSLYFGMPMAGSMQGGLFYPATTLYYLFGFATATALFQILHLFTAGWLCALWLRACRFSWGASLGGAILFAFGGVLIARLPFLNHLATLAWAPALALLFRHRAALALTLCLMVLAGYPTFIPGCAIAAWIASYAARSRRWSWSGGVVDWVMASLLAGALAAAQLLPGFELAALSRRSSGVSLEEALAWGFTPRDLLQWIGPLAVGAARFRPAVDWTLCVYLGLAGAAATAYGAFVLPPRRTLVLAAAFACVVALTLGSSNPVSAALWRHAAPLRFVRYPGNLAYIAMLPLAALAAAGFSRRRVGPVIVLVAALELLALGRSATPLAARGLFTDSGPLVRALRENQDSDVRYLISPKALQASTGSDIFDWKQRLYGLTNAPYRLRSAANFGEPLVPAASYAVMDALLSLSNADEAAGWMPWIGASSLLTPDHANSTRLRSVTRALWELSMVRGRVSLAYHLTPKDGAALPAAWPPVPPESVRSPLVVRRFREDRFEVSGDGAGWAYVAEPRYPGWRTILSTPSGDRRAKAEPALGAFQKIETPSGPWTLRWRYDPGSWRLGVLLALVSWILFARSWYHRAIASGEIR